MQGVYCSPRSWLFAMNVLPRPDRFAAAKASVLCKTLAYFACRPERAKEHRGGWHWLRQVT